MSEDGQRYRVQPAVYFVSAAVLMVLLDRVVPLMQWSTIRFLGLGPALVGLGLGFWAVVQFRRHETTVHPFEQASTLVTDGPYHVTRNPMYTGLLCALLGLALWLGTLTPLLLPPLFAWVMTKRIIVPEEQRLAAQFGDAYRAYQRRVRRWG